MTERVLAAAQQLEQDGVGAAVLHSPTIKPFDGEALLAQLGEGRMVLTEENHSVVGGLLDTEARTMALNGVGEEVTPIALPDAFLEAGALPTLNDHYGVSTGAIVERVRGMLSSDAAPRDGARAVCAPRGRGANLHSTRRLHKASVLVACSHAWHRGRTAVAPSSAPPAASTPSPRKDRSRMTTSPHPGTAPSADPAPLRVGIVGTGAISRAHLPAWTELGAELHCFSLSGAAAFAAESGAAAHGTLEELLAAVDVVDVCVPTPAHPEIVRAALDADKDVICEKPLALDSAEARDLAAH